MFRGLSVTDRLEAARVMGALVAVHFRLKVLPWAWNRRWVFPSEIRSAEPTTALVRRAQRWMNLLKRTSQGLPLNVSCLRQALVLRGRLSVYGMTPRLVYGVRKTGGGSLVAHAWVELGSMRFDPGDNEAGFRPLG